MKRFLVIGAVFCAAAVCGLGLTLFLPPDAAAYICDTEARLTMFKCTSPNCTNPNLPVEVLDCGTSDPPGYYCDCYHVRWQLKCPPPSIPYP